MNTEVRSWKRKFCKPTKDCKICCMTWFLPCVIYARTQRKQGNNYWLYCGLYTCLALIVAPITRYELRKKKNLKGSLCVDILSHDLPFLSVCALLQEYHEVFSEDDGPNSIEMTSRNPTAPIETNHLPNSRPIERDNTAAETAIEEKEKEPEKKPFEDEEPEKAPEYKSGFDDLDSNHDSDLPKYVP